ncbi:hypothetical protein HA402_005659 [Bradysia odoriphaga]|uniref:Microsomal glutathione S-transferase 1 n=1 Tax=Bradysia odoriphaga TaxID=1564500 RepID=A0A2S0E496_9DIPT|nr:glutathione S-transferase [Bradysia odoriphaga]KAG4070427.1 hypothetical protein HA402_005659 [Bradysia odoriphaga]
MSLDLINYNNAVFRDYAFWMAILVIKTLAMGPLTGRQRHKSKIFANAEDAKRVGGSVKFDNDDVERVRRAHRNDLENILPFAIIGFLYVLTQPSEVLANLLFKITAISRIVHTVLYLRSSPSRGIAFMVPLAISLYMAIAVLCYFY